MIVAGAQQQNHASHGYIIVTCADTAIQNNNIGTATVTLCKLIIYSKLSQEQNDI